MPLRNGLDCLAVDMQGAIDTRNSLRTFEAPDERLDYYKAQEALFHLIRNSGLPNCQPTSLNPCHLAPKRRHGIVAFFIGAS